MKRSGIISLKITPETDLLPGRHYLTVGLVCEGGKPIQDKHIRVAFNKIDSDNLTGIEIYSSSLERINMLAEEGVWYDALNEAYALEDKEIFLSLLEQINITKVDFIE